MKKLLFVLLILNLCTLTAFAENIDIKMKYDIDTNQLNIYGNIKDEKSNEPLSAILKYNGYITEDVANYALDLLDVDKEGLDQTDRELLMTIIGKFQGGPVGLDTLAASVGEDAGTIEDVYEPYLLKNGFIQRTPRGRVVTEKTYIHLGISCENEEK